LKAIIDLLVIIDENKTNRGKKIRIKNHFDAAREKLETPFEFLNKTGSWEPFYFDENGSQIQPEVSAT